jgi:L-fuconolactonase
MLLPSAPACEKMVIDSHQHFWQYDRQRHAWITEEMSAIRRDFLPHQLEQEIVANKVDASIVVQVDQTEAETLFLLDLSEDNPRIAGVVGWIDLCSSDIEDRLRHFAGFKKLRGFRHIAQAEPDPQFLARPDFIAGVSRLDIFGFAYDILIYPRQLPAAIELVASLPKQRFVLDHLAKPSIKSRSYGSWPGHVRTLAQNRNVFCKLSGLVSEADWRNWRPEDFHPYLDIVFDAFGPDRLMFGSDWPVCLLAATYDQVKQIIEEYVDNNASRHKEEIFGHNAVRFYQLEAATHGFAAQR